MSDAKTPESAVPATPEPVEPVVVSEPAPVVVEPVAVEPVAPEAVVAESADAVPATVIPATRVVAEKKKRGFGAWSFVLGLLTALGDVAFLVFGIIALVGGVSGIMSGDYSGIGTALGAAGLALLALFIFFGGFVTAGVGAVLGLVALVSGRGRVLGLIGLLLSAAALVVRLALLGAGFSPGLG